MLADECGVMDYLHVNNAASFSYLHASTLRFVLSNLSSDVELSDADLDHSFPFYLAHLFVVLVYQQKSSDDVLLYVLLFLLQFLLHPALASIQEKVIYFSCQSEAVSALYHPHNEYHQNVSHPLRNNLFSASV